MHDDEDGVNDRRTPDQLLTVVAEIPDAEVRAHTLAELVPRLPDSAYEQVIDLAGTVPTQARLRVLARLAELVQPELAERVLSAAGDLTDEYLGGDLIAGVAPRLSASRIVPTWELACALTDPVERDKALTALIPRLPDEHLQAAIEPVNAVLEELFCGGAVQQLFPRLPMTQRRDLAIRALDAAIESFSVVDAEWGCDCMAAAVELLPDDLIGQAFASVCAMPVDSDRASALNMLAHRLPDDLFEEASELTREIKDPELRGWALTQLHEARLESAAPPE